MLFPAYNSTMNDSIPAKYVTVKADSGLTYAHHLPVISGKRSREEDSNNSITMNHQFVPFVQENSNNYYSHNNNNLSSTGSFAFFGEDFSSQIQQHQFEIDRLIANHMENVILEMEERRRKCARTMMAVVQDSITKKLKSKEEEIEKIGRLNSSLVDRVKSLYVENQIWRDLAQTNEATATALRNNLEQVLAQVQGREINGGVADDELLNDAQSCCGSNYNEDNNNDVDVGSSWGVANGKLNDNMLCRSCGKEEACVMLLPCRHLCLCNRCASYLHICPVCKSSKSCSLHVNLST